MSDYPSLLSLDFLSQNAIILIYPDGTYDSVQLDLSKRLNHIDYFKMMAKSSERFEMIFRNFPSSIMFYGPLVRVLAKIGIGTILNWRLGLQEGIVPYLSIYLPENNTSYQEQILHLILNEYDYTKKMVSIYDSNKNDFHIYNDSFPRVIK